MSARSHLYVPANDLERLTKALGRGADALIVDLEDGVSPTDKDLARQNLTTFLENLDSTVEIWVRVNPEKGESIGVFHFGMWVDDLDQAEEQAKSAGATYLKGRPDSPNSFYEAKYQDHDGSVFDMTHKGWAGAVKEPTATN